MLSDDPVCVFVRNMFCGLNIPSFNYILLSIVERPPSFLQVFFVLTRHSRLMNKNQTTESFTVTTSYRIVAL